MGQRDFPARWHGLDPQRGAMLGMSLLLAARGLGALVGPLFSARWAGRHDYRLRLGILLGYLTVAAGYAALGGAGSVWIACLFVMLAHCGGSTIWVFSTTLLQLHTDDRFRGRVFAADLGFCMLTIAVGAYLCGLFLDWGVPTRVVATTTGLLMLLPAGLWAWAMRKSGKVKVRVMWCSFTAFHSGTSCRIRFSSLPFIGGTPPRQGTQVFAAKSDIQKSSQPNRVPVRAPPANRLNA